MASQAERMSHCKVCFLVAANGVGQGRGKSGEAMTSRSSCTAN